MKIRQNLSTSFKTMTAKYFFVFLVIEVRKYRLKIPFRISKKNIKDIRPLYGISENGHQNLEEYLKNKLQFKRKILL
jgi:hypothetical protein